MSKALPAESEMDRATYARDGSYDGVFFVCVRTTGVFCRPSCAARKPKKKNLIYRATVQDCLLDGYRPCKRCRPLAVDGRDADWLGRLIETTSQSPRERLTDADLAAMGLSPCRVRRYFVKNFGMTFQAYHRTRRMGLALEQLQSGDGSIAAASDQSFKSLSGFRDAFKRVFGTTPGRSAGVHRIVTTRSETPIGPIVLGATESGVCLLEFADRWTVRRPTTLLRQPLNGVVVPGRNEHLDRLACELREYFGGERRTFSVPLVLSGTAFQKAVWEELRRIPFGTTISYAELARRIGQPFAQRAVGRANGENRMAILVPCHRVVKNDGTLCGYGGGLWRKQHLLNLERTAARGEECAAAVQAC